MSDTPIIAVVDDDDMVGEATAELIESFGLAARLFNSADAYLSSGCIRHTSCLVADMQMPGVDGLQLQHQLAKCDRRIPVVFVSAFPDERIRERAMKAGAVCYLRKPFEPLELLGCIRSAIGDRVGGPNA